MTFNGIYCTFSLRDEIQFQCYTIFMRKCKNEDNSRENFVKFVSFGLEQWNQRDRVTQELPKKKKKSEDNSSTVRERVNRKLCVEKFSNTRISE